MAWHGDGGGASVNLSAVATDITFTTNGAKINFPRGGYFQDYGTNIISVGGDLYAGNLLASQINVYGTGIYSFGNGGSVVPLTVQGGASQTGNLLNLNNVSNSTLAYFDKDGNLVCPSITLTTKLTTGNGGTGNANGAGLLSDGTVNQATGTVTLTATSAPLRTCDNSNRTFNMPLANTCAGKTFLFMYQGSGVQTFSRQGSDTLNGATSSLKLAGQGRTVLAVSDGVSNWSFSMLPALTTATAAGQFPYIDSNGNIAYASAAAATRQVMGTDGSGFPSYSGMNMVVSASVVSSGTVALTATSEDFQTSSCAGGNTNYTFAAASTCPGKRFVFVKTGASNTMNINSNNAVAINGSTSTIALTTQYDKVMIISDGSAYYRLI